MKRALLLLIVNLAFSTYARECPCGWVQGERNTCLQVFTASVTHQQAQAACKAQGATLATLNSSERNARVESYLRDMYTELTQTCWWIGATRTSRGFFWWDGNGEKYPLTFTNWDVLHGQPDNHNESEDKIQICSYNDDDYKEYFAWNDNTSVAKYSYICEKWLSN